MDLTFTHLKDDQPRIISVNLYEASDGRRVALVQYGDEPFTGCDEFNYEGPKYMAFWSEEDLSSLMMLFYFGDRTCYKTPQEALYEMVKYPDMV